MKALSIRAPWWWAILHAGKDIENRDWYTSYRGPVLIHASKWWSQRAVSEAMDDVRDMFMRAPDRMHWPSGWTYRDMRDLGGHVVGYAEIVDCVAESTSSWFAGKYGLVLANAHPITPRPLKGRLGLFDAPREIVAEVA